MLYKYTYKYYWFIGDLRFWLIMKTLSKYSWFTDKEVGIDSRLKWLKERPNLIGIWKKL